MPVIPPGKSGIFSREQQRTKTLCLALSIKEEFYKIKKACIEVRKNLGNGFLEKVYENALKIELENNGFHVESQKEINVNYKDHIVGSYYADLVVNKKVIIELKTITQLLPIHKSQLLNYLVVTSIQLGILINFPNDHKGFEIIRIPDFISIK